MCYKAFQALIETSSDKRESREPPRVEMRSRRNRKRQSIASAATSSRYRAFEAAIAAKKGGTTIPFVLSRAKGFYFEENLVKILKPLRG